MQMNVLASNTSHLNIVNFKCIKYVLKIVNKPFRL